MSLQKSFPENLDSFALLFLVFPPSLSRDNYPKNSLHSLKNGSLTTYSSHSSAYSDFLLPKLAPSPYPTLLAQDILPTSHINLLFQKLTPYSLLTLSPYSVPPPLKRISPSSPSSTAPYSSSQFSSSALPGSPSLFRNFFTLSKK